MKTLEQTHSENKQVLNDISFLKQEITFFLKLLSREYKKPVPANRVKLFDAYWKEFEHYRKRLDEISVRVMREEHALSDAFKEDDTDTERIRINNEIFSLLRELNALCSELKTLKESFYSTLTQII